MASTTTPAKAKEQAPVEGPPAPAAEAPAAPAAGTHVVLRPFFGGGAHRVVGEVVDATAWRSAERLCEGRYIRPLLAADPQPVTDGTLHFIDDDSLLAYIDSMPVGDDDALTGKEG
jgi:hypothetical protein